MTLKKLLLMAVALLVAVSSANGAKRQPAILNKVDKKAMEAWVNSTFNQLTPEERIAQLIVMAVSPRDTRAEAVVDKYVSEYKIGGLIFHESDIRSQAKITSYAQSKSKVPLMITLDAEWGPSMRLEDAPKFPRNLFLGAISDDQVFYEYGREVARQCKRMGVHVNFAPVLDVIDRPKTVLGTRAYGSNPTLVGNHGVAFARGMEDGGVLSVMKHFPGHGSTTADSHLELPTVDKSMKELMQYDLAPFKQYIEAGLGGCLTAHLYIPAIEKRRVPGTMSKAYVTDLLQKKMNFTGLIFTDALGMEGAKEVEGSVCVNAFLAGNDILLMPNEVGPEIAAIKEAIAKGKIKQKDIDARVKKILRFKYALGLDKEQKIDLSNIVADVNAPEAKVLQRKLTASTVTVVKSAGDLLPLKNLNKRKIAVVPIGNENGVKSMFARRCGDYAEATIIDYKKYPVVETLQAKLMNEGYNTLIVCVASTDEASINYARLLMRTSADAIVATMCHPEKLDMVGDLLNNDAAKASLVAYANTMVDEDYLAQTIFGGNAAKGVLPVDMNTPRGLVKAGTGVTFDACRLGYTIPEEVGFNGNLLAKIDSVCNYGVQQKAFPGCQVVVARHGKVVCKRSYGEIAYGMGIPVTDNTLYGLASVSKATGTLSGVMKVYDEGKLQLDQPASDIIPGMKVDDKKDITFRQLLYHETGMQPSLNMWNMMFDPKTYKGKLITTTPDEHNTILIMKDAYGNKYAKLRTDILSRKKTDVFNLPIAEGLWGSKATYDSIMARIYTSQLGEKTYLYSCLNFCLLANAVENITKQPLNTFVQNDIFAPLGAFHTMYRPLEKFPQHQIAYTEVDTYLRRQHIHGYVHDELAAFSGGVQGNAGLFSNANDLCKIFQMWLNGGVYGGDRYLKQSTVETFLTSKSPNSHRGLGFDKPRIEKPEWSSTCDEASPETVGHTGFTGTCYWVDPKTDMIYIFLCNRVSPTRSNPNFGRVSARSHIQSILYHAIVK
ncbi:MAG: glycoside hydrolase family 3 N-terminal domain-containing protein [Bacteroidales bacterium]|nr:glycoside hydrolase family 3 N-terminal domain-containing protein [Bacteroidales bacterium]